MDLRVIKCKRLTAVRKEEVCLYPSESSELEDANFWDGCEGYSSCQEECLSFLDSWVSDRTLFHCFLLL